MPLASLVPESMQVGAPVVTDGLYAGRIDNAFVLRGSSVIFMVDSEAAKDIDLTALNNKSALRFEGVIAFREDTKTHYVKVKRVLQAPDARDAIVAMLKDPDVPADRLVAMGKWAKKRAGEFADERLASLADAAFVRALEVEERSLAPNDYEGRFRIAEESVALLKRPNLRETYIRKGISVFLAAQPAKTAETYYDAAKKADALMPGGTLSEQLLEEGFRLESGGRDEKNAADFYALATKAGSIFGEGPHSRNLLAKALDKEYAGIDETDYAALYALARKAKEIYPDYPEYHSLVVRAFSAEKAAMDQRDPQALIRLGNRILYFLDDKYQAGLLFRTAAGLDPANSEIRAKLRELGYAFYQGSWWRAEEFGKSDIFKKTQELEELAAAGTVAVGMSRDQVLRAKGAPAEVNVSAGGWGVTMQWVYHDAKGVTWVSLIADTVIAKGETTAN
jgi:hypothetical protein